jgi:hypothetical protein
VSQPHPINAVLAMIVFGIPGLLYAIRGRFRNEYENVLEISPEDPLFQHSVKEAQESLPNFRALVEKHPDSGYIKFPFTTPSGFTEHIWGFVQSVSNDSFRVTIDTPPVSEEFELPEFVNVDSSQIEDWQVALPDGSISGGYTVRAQIKMCERDGLEIPSHVKEYAAKLVP